MKFFYWAVGVAAVIGGLAFFYSLTVSEGRADFIRLANEYNMCTDADCEDGQQEMLSMLQSRDASYSSLEQIHWCLGTDLWAETQVRRGAFFKSILVNLMYMRCPTD